MGVGLRLLQRQRSVCLSYLGTARGDRGFGQGNPAYSLDDFEGRSGFDREGVWRRGRPSAALLSSQGRWQQGLLQRNTPQAVPVRDLDGPGARLALGECIGGTWSRPAYQGRLCAAVRAARVRWGKAQRFFRGVAKAGTDTKRDRLCLLHGSGHASWWAARRRHRGGGADSLYARGTQRHQRQWISAPLPGSAAATPNATRISTGARRRLLPRGLWARRLERDGDRSLGELRSAECHTHTGSF